MKYVGKWKFLETRDENILLTMKPSKKLWNLLLQWPRGFKVYMRIHSIPLKVLYCALSNAKIMHILHRENVDFSLSERGRNLANIARSRGDRNKVELLFNMGITYVEHISEQCLRSYTDMKRVLEDGADPTREDYLSLPLNDEISTLLISHGAIINPETFHWKNLGPVLKSGLNVNNYKREGIPYLCHAIKMNDIEAIKLCSQYGADFAIEDDDGNGTDYYALKYPHEGMIELCFNLYTKYLENIEYY